MTQVHTTPVPKVYAAICAIQSDLSTVGISKSRKATMAGGTYNFRGIDDVYSALSPLLAKHKLCVLPRMVSRSVHERTTKNGGVLFYVTLEAEFDFVAVEDGSMHTVRTFGEAMDSGDKATNKAMSAAYKYAAFQAFAIPTEGDNDSENNAYEVVSARQVTPISEAQYGTLITMIEQSGADARKFCINYKISAVNQLAATDYDNAFANLEKKLKAKEASEVSA